MTAAGQIFQTMFDGIHSGKNYKDYRKVRTLFQETMLDPLAISAAPVKCATLTRTEILWPPPLLHGSGGSPCDGWICCSVGVAAAAASDARHRHAQAGAQRAG